MKKSIILALCVITFNCTVTFGQNTKTDTLLMKIDTSLAKISETVGVIKDEIVEEKSKPFTGQSIFEDSKGKSAIFLPNGGTFGLNISDASLRLSFSQNVSTSPLFLGLDVSGKTNDGILSLISKGNISPGAKVNGVVGVNELFHKYDRLDGWLALRVGYEGSSFKFYKPDSAFSKQISKTTFDSFVTSLSFNLKIDGNKILAISIGYQKANNYSDLDDIELTDTKTITDTLTNTTRTYETKTNAKVGDYKVFQQMPINLDYFWTPRNLPRIGFYHYLRSTYSVEDKNFQNGLGTGIYLLKKNNPLSSIAGVVFEIKDIKRLSENYGKGFVVNIVASYNFGFTKRK